MLLLRTIWDGLRSLRRKDEECELDEEFRASFDAPVQEKMKVGLSHKEAVRSALIEMCGLRVVPGIAAGVVLSLMLAPLLSSLLFGVCALDPTTFATVSVFLFFVAAIACSIPACRATAIAPVAALRYE